MVTLNMLTEVLRRHGIGDPVSKISVDLKTPESTIRDWLKFAQQHSLTFTKIAGMTLKQFKEIRAQSSQPCARMLQPDWDYIVAESRKPGETLQSLYEAYFRTEPTEPHMKRSSFYLKYKQIKETVDVDVMRLCLHNSFRPAEVVMIDYSGDVLKGKDKGGHAFKGQVFVAVLGCSGYIFCTVTPGQTRADWFHAMSAMFSFYGGSTEELWLDNSTPLVRRPDRTDPVLTPEFKNFCNHYSIAANAVAPREPTYKGLVENAVKQVQDFVLKPLAGRQFFSIAGMVQAVEKQLPTLNGRPLTNGKKATRQKRFQSREAEYLKPLPFIPYNTRLQVVERTVLDGDRIRIDNLRYAVPWGHHGQVLLVAIDAGTRTIRMYLKDTREFLAETQLRSPEQGDEPTRLEFVPDELRPVAMNREELLEFLKTKFGEKAMKLARSLAKSSNSIASKHLRGLLSASKHFEMDVFEEICEQATDRAEITYAGFKKICAEFEAAGKRKKLIKTKSTKSKGTLPPSRREDVRGADYFNDEGENHEKD